MSALAAGLEVVVAEDDSVFAAGLDAEVVLLVLEVVVDGLAVALTDAAGVVLGTAVPIGVAEALGGVLAVGAGEATGEAPGLTEAAGETDAAAGGTDAAGGAVGAVEAP